MIFRYGGFARQKETPIWASRRCWRTGEEKSPPLRSCRPPAVSGGQRIVSAGEPANSLFFLQSGMVSVKLPSGVRLASLGPGMEFGEMAIIEEQRSADVWADTPVNASNCRSTTLPIIASASGNRHDHHAKSRRAAVAAADHRQHQGRPAQRILGRLRALIQIKVGGPTCNSRPWVRFQSILGCRGESPASPSGRAAISITLTQNLRKFSGSMIKQSIRRRIVSIAVGLVVLMMATAGAVDGDGGQGRPPAR